MAGDSSTFRFGVRRRGEPCTVVLFGASGDLAKRKVIPAMYDLAIHNALGPRYAIVGFARTPMTEESFSHHHRRSGQDHVRSRPHRSRNSGMNLLPISITAPAITPIRKPTRNSPSASPKLEAQKNLGGNRLFYLSTPPEVYPDIVEQLGRAGLARPAFAELLGAHHH